MKKQFCIHDHDVFVTGRTNWGVCIICKQNIDKRFANSDKRKEYDKQYKQDNINKIKEQQKQHYKINKDKILARHKQYNDEHIEELKVQHKDYKKRNPDVVILTKLRADANRNLRVVSWGQEGIKEFLLNKPVELSIDHIIPLRAKLVSGLHVIWNLQYMPYLENNTKQNRCTPEEATQIYNKILEEAGLK